MTSIDAHENEDDEVQEETHIHWSNVIFLPFHPIFKLFVMCSVITKVILGPIQAVYPVVYCWKVMDNYLLLQTMKFYYMHFADPIYAIDTFLYIVHRQVTEEALKREHLPKSALCLILDFAALVPFFKLAAINVCPPAQLWPNLLSFSESLLVYRLFQYFKILKSHSVINIMVAFMLLTFCILNIVTCLFIMLTYEGLCKRCKGNIYYDWRLYFKDKWEEGGEAYSTYLFGMVFVFDFIYATDIDDTRPFTMRGHLIMIILAIFGYFLYLCIILPKVFAEIILRLRRVATTYPHVRRLVEETKRRTGSVKACTSVENFYNVMWRKREGLTRVPENIRLPRYLRIDVAHDLCWAFFYHSPTLRKTSLCFKRFVVQSLSQDFKLPGERFFTGPESHTNIYYIKSGVVQILSGDEGMTPILSVAGGTVLGDVSFYLPNWRRNVIIKCLTYCEIIYLSRQNYIRALSKFPQDRLEIFQLTQERIHHAKTLYACKQKVLHLSRADDEGIFWVKRRWWELVDYITNWKNKTRKDGKRCDLPPEETEYHCAKYIGQLVLCTEAQLLTKSLFANVQFPWLFVPHSSFIFGWRKVVLVTVILVLLFYPPFITAKYIPTWFKFFQAIVDLIYMFDIFLSLHTATARHSGETINFVSVMFSRCKTLYFTLDFLSTIWIEYAFVLVGRSDLFYLARANRLIKVYLLFTDEYSQRNITKNPLLSVIIKICLWQFVFMYLYSHMVYAMYTTFHAHLTLSFFFGELYCDVVESNICDPATKPLGIFVAWVLEVTVFAMGLPDTLLDVYVFGSYEIMRFFLYVYCKASFISVIYLKHRDISNYQSFVSNLKKYYEYYKIHQDLLKRLEGYLVCHWKYYHGADVMHPHILKNEPYDIFWKVQGEVAERTISQSEAFVGADPALVKELAYCAKFLTLPKDSTLFMFGVHCRMVTWVVQGYVKCEYHNDEGELLKVFHPPGKLLSVSAVFMRQPSLRTYSACTDCEIIYIKKQDFYKIMKHYPHEWSHLDKCITEFSPFFEDLFQKYEKKHKNYEKKLRNRVFHARRSTVAIKKIKSLDKIFANTTVLPIEHDFWSEPESDFMQYWMLFRAIIVVVSIVNAAVQGGSGVIYRRNLRMVGAFCDCISWIDVVLKLFMAYYDSKGVLIYDKQKCMLRYLTRGFLLDLIGSAPWDGVLNKLMTLELGEDTYMLINTCCKFAHLYILIGYLNYLSDWPSINTTYITILKLQLTMLLIAFGTCHYLMSYCVDFTFNDHADVVEFQFLNSCWLPTYFPESENNDKIHYLHLIYAESINLAQSGLSGINNGRFTLNRTNLTAGVPIILLSLVFWYVMGYSVTLLLLNSRGHTVFQHGIGQLTSFLTAERVDKKLIERAVLHFTYWWHRTKGINIQHLTNERIGVVFRQDLSYYFFKKTLLALNFVLKGNEKLCRELASLACQIYLLPGEEITREMDLTSTVYVVHRGKVVISKDGETVASLSTGSIFGQLEGKTSRPIKISAQAEEHVDLLMMNIKQFQEVLPDDVKKNMAKYSTFKNDYIANKKYVVENPYDSMTYILRGRKTIMLPWMSAPLVAHFGMWYFHWLHFAWLWEPFVTALVVITMQTLPLADVYKIYPIAIFLDTFFFTNVIFEFFTVELEVVEQKCVRRKVGRRMFKKFSFYIDLITLFVPHLIFLTNNPIYQMIRILRLRHLINFQKYMIQSFKGKAGPVFTNFITFILIIHSITCGWLVIACKNPFPIPSPTGIEASVNESIDTDEWAYPIHRPGGSKGCAEIYDEPTRHQTVFLVPTTWFKDYIVATAYITLILTSIPNDSIVPVTISQIYFQVIITFIIYVLKVWLMSMSVDYGYTKLRKLYQYDYHVQSLIIYLERSGLSPALLDLVKKYTSRLWEREQGNWLPELAQQAPMCLREDLFCALYQHHLDKAPVFRDLPQYFKRQLAARLERIVVFPGKCIVSEGDRDRVIYFIHEGEVEKWGRDKNGENKLISMLSITGNNYFGQLAGIYYNFPYQFSYYSHTVVDMVYLNIERWQYLLDGYPKMRREVMKNAKAFQIQVGWGSKGKQY